MIVIMVMHNINKLAAISRIPTVAEIDTEVKGMIDIKTIEDINCTDSKLTFCYEVTIRIYCCCII